MRTLLFNDIAPILVHKFTEAPNNNDTRVKLLAETRKLISELANGEFAPDVLAVELRGNLVTIRGTTLNVTKTIIRDLKLINNQEALRTIPVGGKGNPNKHMPSLSIKRGNKKKRNYNYTGRGQAGRTLKPTPLI